MPIDTDAKKYAPNTRPGTPIIDWAGYVDDAAEPLDPEPKHAPAWLGDFVVQYQTTAAATLNDIEALVVHVPAPEAEEVASGRPVPDWL